MAKTSELLDDRFDPFCMHADVKPASKLLMRAIESSRSSIETAVKGSVSADAMRKFKIKVVVPQD
jgi:hypothetical protein